MAKAFEIYGYNSMSEAGFPDILSPVIFVKGCNMRCPYCMNCKLVTGQKNGQPIEPINLNKVIKEIKKDDNDCVLISGGEPCDYPQLNELIEFLNKKGLGVLLSTNASCPYIVSKLITNNKIEFIAVDIKTGFDNAEKWQQVSSDPYIMAKVLETIDVISYSNIKHEFRTTLYPPLVNEQDILSIATTIDKTSPFILQQFRKKTKALDNDVVQKVEPYDKESIRKFLTIAKEHVDQVNVRYT